MSDLPNVPAEPSPPLRLPPGPSTSESDLDQALQKGGSLHWEGEADWDRLFGDSEMLVALRQGPEHLYRYANRKHQRIVGGDRPLVGRKLREAFPELAGQGIFRRFDSVFQTGKPDFIREMPLRLSLVDGPRDLFLNIALQPWFDNEGRVGGVLSLAYEATEQVRAREQFQDTTFRLALALRTAALGTHDYHLETGEIFLDERGLEMFGVEHGGSLPIDVFWERMNSDDRPRVEAAVNDALDPDQRAPYDVEYRFDPLDNSPQRWIRATGRPILSGDEARSRPIRFVGTVQDITRRKEEEEELRKARDAAEMASRAKTAFLSHMSHDIRTPLTAILGYAEVLSQRVQGAEADMALRIRGACTRLLSTLDSVLRFARLEGRKTPLELKAEALADELSRTCELFDDLASKQQVQLIRRSLDPHLQARVDVGALARVVSNLIDNAIKFSRPGGTVEIGLGRVGAMACISVRDQGVGMSAAFQNELFQPFSQERQKQRTALAGSGMGMAITHQLVQLMDGRIEVTSEEGKGTEVRVFLPLIELDGPPSPMAPAEAAPSLPALAAAADASPPSAKPRLLVCEDYAGTRNVLRLLLEDYSIDFASNQEELFASLQGQDLILLDINLEGRNVDRATVEALRRTPTGRRARIVAFTAHSMPGQREEFLAEGFDDYLAKPFTVDGLMRVIDGAKSGRDP